MKSLMVIFNMSEQYLSGSMATVDSLLILNKIVKKSILYQNIYIVDDLHHKDDYEFTFLPVHATMVQPYPIETQMTCNLIQRFNKNKMSAWKNDHIRRLIVNKKFDKIELCGFFLSTDILPTAIDMIQDGYKPIVDKELCSDFTDSTKRAAISYMNLLFTND